MEFLAHANTVVKELENTLSKVDPAQVEKLVGLISDSKRIFLAGAGRSGFMIRAAAMRFMHLGLSAYVVGEAVTPNIEAGDLLLIGSGSGETGSLVHMAGKAKKLGANLAVITIFPESSIGKLADAAVKIPASTPKSEIESGFTSVQPMGSLFEQSLLLLLDTVMIVLMERKGMGSDAMFTRHANLE